MRAFLGRHWFLLALALGVGTTLLWPAALRNVTDWWEPRITVAFALFLMALTMPGRSLVAEARQPFASIWAVVLSYGLVPPAAWLLGMLAPKDVQVGLILVASVPCTLASAVLWTRLAGGNEATALLTVLGTTFLSWFLTTVWLLWLAGAEVEIRVGAMMLDLVLSLIVPVLAGQGLRGVRRCAETADRYRVALGVASQMCIVAIVLKAGVAVGDKLDADQVFDAPMIFLAGVALAVALHLMILAAGYFSCGWLGFDRSRQIAVAFSASQKTLQVSLLLYDQYFKESHAFAVIPLLAYHIGQLLLDTVIARRMSAASPKPEA